MPETIAEKLTLIGQAMVELRPLDGRFDGLRRRFCPHAVGRGRPSGPLRVFVWQFGGETHADDPLPNWRCFELARLEALTPAPGPWRRGGLTRGLGQSCLALIELKVSPEHTTADLG